MFTLLFTILGLIVFEVVSSVDNAIVNAHVLKTMSPKWRKIFLFWGILTAVFILRGLLPFMIVWMSVPEIGLTGTFQSVIHSDPEVALLIEERKGIILIGAGIFLLLLYLHWLFLEPKDPYFILDKLLKPNHGVWFFACAAVILVAILYLARSSWPTMLASAIGYAVFFIMNGFREQAAEQEKRLKSNQSHLSNFSKLMFLEVLDASFSFDGVFGAFAFTRNILLILIGNGIGALVVRELTIKGIDRVTRYKWLKNGAMTSIGFLGMFMILETFGWSMPEWLPTLTTLGLVGFSFLASHRLLKNQETN